MAKFIRVLNFHRIVFRVAWVVEKMTALDSKSSFRKEVKVRFLFRAQLALKRLKLSDFKPFFAFLIPTPIYGSDPVKTQKTRQV